MCFCQILADSKRVPVFEVAKIRLFFCQFPSSFDVSSRNYRQNSPFPKKNWHHVAWSLFEARSFAKWWWESASWGLWKTTKKVFQLVTGRARKPDPIRCFFKNFVVTYQPPPLWGHQVSGRFGGENERMWVKGHSIKSHGFLKVYHLEHLEPTFLIYFRVLCGYASVVLRGSQRNWGERIPLPNFWKNIQVEPALSSTGRNHLNFTVVDPCCARSHSCTLGCTRCVRMMMGFLPSKNLTKMMILQQSWWGFRMIFLSSHVFHMFSLLRGWHCFNVNHAIKPFAFVLWSTQSTMETKSGISWPIWDSANWDVRGLPVSPKRSLIQRELPLDFSFCQLQMSKFYQICLCF